MARNTDGAAHGHRGKDEPSRERKSIGMMINKSSSVRFASALIYLFQVSALPQFSRHAAFVHSSNFARRHLFAFIDNTNKLDLSPVKIHSMPSSDAETMTDAEAYHEMVSAAVDLTGVYVRNGMISGRHIFSSLAHFTSIHQRCLHRLVF